MSKEFNLLDMSRDGQATVLRGFAKQIQILQVPQLKVVRQIGREIGLIVLTAQEFKDLTKTTAETVTEVEVTLAEKEKEINKAEAKLKAISMITGSGNMTLESKLEEIVKVLNHK